MKQVSHNIFRGPRPDCIDWLKQREITAVLDVQSNYLDSIDQNQYEKEIEYNLGIISARVPLSNWRIPSTKRLSIAASQIDIFKRNGRKIYVHCRWGKDRTGMVIAAWRILYDGYTPAMAMREMFREGFRKYWYFLWIPQLWRIERRLK